MLQAIVLVVFGLLILVVGGELLLRGAVRLATLFRVPPTIIGLTIVAAGTSIPELAVSVAAGLQDKPDITVGNVVGSNIFNLLVIVGVCALIRPISIEGNLLRFEYPVLILATLSAVAVCDHGKVSRFDGVFFCTSYLFFTAFLIRLVRDKVTRSEETAFAEEAAELANANAHQPGWGVTIALIVLGIALLAVGVEVTLRGAIELGKIFGLSDRVIGSDIAIGNVIGSNLFNILVILGLSSILLPLPVHPNIQSFDNWWHLGTTLLLITIIRAKLSVMRWEGVLLIAVYIFYIYLLLERK
jgi:cation:H+ antiporter